ncbi:hypothetical protein [Roseibium marinum]|uniref:Uncharacterized protein n=1 Tax=Roseibium marinum TaxID=281252 RepID=A0A2S3UW17_9HYPH|nr:hypothetical protein [Roseibium marinum]POF31770.1 hypothetical protein CLV41_104340 [Roseibium marinum]
MDQLVTENTGLSVAGQTLFNHDETFHEIEKHITVPEELQDTPIFKSGLVLEIRNLENPIARQIVEAMKASSSAHAFASVQDLRDNIAFRLHAIDAMTFCNTGKYDMDYFNPSIDLQPRIGSTDASRLSRFWAFLHPHAQDNAEFSQVRGTLASEAIAPMANATFPFRGECAGAFQMAVYFGLLTGLGQKRFDAMASDFGTMYIGPWSLVRGTPNPATLFMKSASLKDPPIPGDYMYFKNKDDYLTWAPDGFWTGLNAMYMGKDEMGTRHYSGMGASWLSETNLRASLINAYYHDCFPHTISNPVKEVRFTERNLLTIPAQLQAASVPSTPARDVQRGPAFDTTRLRKAGFAMDDAGIWVHPGTTLGQMCKDLEISPDDLHQVASAGIKNPPHRYTRDGISVIIHYADPATDRRDTDAPVTAHVNPKQGS